MENPKLVVGYLMNDELFVKSVTTPKHLEWLKWLDPEELTAFFEELLRLATQISEKKKSAKTLSIFLSGWHETALLNSEFNVLADIDEAEQELEAPWIDIVEKQREQKPTISKTYAEPEPMIDLTEQERDHYVAQSILELKLSVRANNCLAWANIKTVRDLVIKTERELLAYKGLGRGSLLEIKEQLANIGLYLGMDLDDEDYEEDEDIYEEGYDR